MMGMKKKVLLLLCTTRKKLAAHAEPALLNSRSLNLKLNFLILLINLQMMLKFVTLNKSA